MAEHHSQVALTYLSCQLFCARPWSKEAAPKAASALQHGISMLSFLQAEDSSDPASINPTLAKPGEKNQKNILALPHCASSGPENINLDL